MNGAVSFIQAAFPNKVSSINGLISNAESDSPTRRSNWLSQNEGFPGYSAGVCPPGKLLGQCQFTSLSAWDDSLDFDRSAERVLSWLGSNPGTDSMSIKGCREGGDVAFERPLFRSLSARFSVHFRSVNDTLLSMRFLVKQRINNIK